MHDKWQVLLPKEMNSAGLEMLSQFSELTWLGEFNTRSDLERQIGTFDAIIKRGGITLTKLLIEKATNLKIITTYGVGIDNIDVEAASNHGVVVCNNPAANAQAVAEHAFCMMLLARKNVLAAHTDLQSGVWDRQKYEAPEIQASTLGIFGCGDIGRRVARLAQGFGMDCFAYDPYLHETEFPPNVKRINNKKELFDVSDIITIHVPLTEETRHTISMDELSKLGSEGILVNTSRGDVIDEDALLSALDNDRLSWAALDVFSQEPLPEEHTLLDHRNVITTPHIAGTTREASREKSLRAAENIRAVYDDTLPSNTVNIDCLVSPSTFSPDRWRN